MLNTRWRLDAITERAGGLRSFHFVSLPSDDTPASRCELYLPRSDVREYKVGSFYTVHIAEETANTYDAKRDGPGVIYDADGMQILDVVHANLQTGVVVQLARNLRGGFYTDGDKLATIVAHFAAPLTVTLLNGETAK